MAFNGMTMTTKGVTLQTKVQAGATLSFTKIKLGDGTLPTGGTLEALTDLVSPKLIVNIESVTSLGDGTWRVRGTLTNTGLAAGFFVREVGLFGTDPDDGEVLYSVANAGSQCDYLPAGGGAVVVEQVVDIVVAISSSTTVTATIDEAAVFVSLSTYNEHLEKAHHLWQASTAYAVGDIVYTVAANSSFKFFQCTVAGTSGANEPTWPAVGSTVVDGTVTWQSRRLGNHVPYNRQMYTTTGTPTFTAPVSGLYKVTVIGGGGGGGGVNVSGSVGAYAGGGGAGGLAIKHVFLAAGDNVTVTVGGGGAGGNGLEAGYQGGTSSFGSHCSATGGGGGNYANSSSTTSDNAPGGNGGIGSSGDINGYGGTGQAGIPDNMTTGSSGYGGPGGASYLSSGPGINVTGTPANSILGAGGMGAVKFGAGTAAGGAGGAGVVIVEW